MKLTISSFFRRRRLFCLFGFILSIAILEFLGIFIHPFELDFYTQFSYPLSIPNFQEFVQLYERGLNPNDIKAINEYPYRYVIMSEEKCLKKDLPKFNISTTLESTFVNKFEEITLLIIVKSSIDNTLRRDYIRNSWGFENRFSDVKIRTLFMVGTCGDLPEGVSKGLNEAHLKYCQDRIDDEAKLKHDIIQANFVDSYFNNTIKTIMSMRWVLRHCYNAHFLLLVDDDYYVSVKNLLKFIRDPFSDQKLDISDPSKPSPKVNFDGRLYAGFVFPASHPMRHKFNKWYVSLKDYRYSRYPPYVTAGAILFSKSSIIDMYTASLFTKHFKFDDIYVAILAKKMGIIPFHSPKFRFWSRPASDLEYSKTIASHGFSDPSEMVEIWEEQKSLGNA